MDREENRLYIEAIKLAAGSVQYKNISVKDTMIKAVEQLYRYYEITMDEGYLETAFFIYRHIWRWDFLMKKEKKYLIIY